MGCVLAIGHKLFRSRLTIGKGVEIYLVLKFINPWPHERRFDNTKLKKNTKIMLINIIKKIEIF